MALTNEQLTQLQNVAAAAAKAAVEATKITLPTKNPATLHYKTDDIDEYLVVWDNYAKVKQVKPEERLASFLTYLDPMAQENLQNLDFTNKTWPQTKTIIRSALENRLSSMEARQLIIIARQEEENLQ